MYKKILISLVLVLFLIIKTESQSLTISPYSRYGIGDLSFNGLASNVAMGRTAIGKQNPGMLNPINPASYGNFIPKSFIFNVGYVHKLMESETANNVWLTNNSNLQYMVAGFYIRKWWGTSFGMLPVSNIGYDISSTDTIFAEDEYTEVQYSYIGGGGINKFYWGNTFKPYKNLCLGINLNYNFGSIDRTNSAKITETSYSNYTEIKKRYLIGGFNYNLGLQYSDSIMSKKDKSKSLLIFTAGIILDNSSNLRTINTLRILQLQSLNQNYFSDTISNDTTSVQKLGLPQNYGFGLALKFNQQLTLAFDYSIQKWSKVTPLDGNYQLEDNKLIGLGLEYCLNEYSTIYYKTLRYRVGAYQEDSYVSMQLQPIKKYAITFGLGIPIRSSLINVSFELGTRGTTEFNLVKERYALFNLDFSLYELWFVKSKFY